MTDNPDDDQTLDDVVVELQTQNALLKQVVEAQKSARPVLHTALGVLLAFACLWGVAQTNWGAENVAVPVKFFVSDDQAESIEGVTDPGSEDLDIYGADGSCIGSDDVTADDYDPDC